MVVCTPEQIQILDQNKKPIKRDVLQVTWSLEDAEKEGYEHFMLKEIHEQPKAMQGDPDPEGSQRTARSNWTASL